MSSRCFPSDSFTGSSTFPSLPPVKNCSLAFPDSSFRFASDSCMADLCSSPLGSNTLLCPDSSSFFPSESATVCRYGSVAAPEARPLPWMLPDISPFFASETCGGGASACCCLKMSCPTSAAVLAGFTARVGEGSSAASEKHVLARSCFFPSLRLTVRRNVGAWAGASEPNTIWEAPPGGFITRDDGLRWGGGVSRGVAEE